MNNNINALTKIGLWFKTKFTLEKSDLLKYEEFAKTLSFGIYTDKKIHDKELVIVKKIILKHYHKKEVDFILNLVKSNLAYYSKNSYSFTKHKEEVLLLILNGNKWYFADILIEIFGADDSITREENEIIAELKDLVQSRNNLYRKLGLKKP